MKMLSIVFRGICRLAVMSLLVATIAFSAGNAQAATLTWNGGDGNWNTSSPNWTGGAGIFVDGDDVIFANTGIGTVIISANMQPLSTTVNNTSGTYIFTNGPIASGTLTKNGNGTLTLSSSNNFSGVTLSAGTLSFGNNYGIGTNILTINGGTIYNGGSITLPNNPIVINNSFTISSATAQNFNPGSGLVTLNNNITVNYASGGSPTWAGNIINNGYKLTVINSGDSGTTISGKISGSGGLTLRNDCTANNKTLTINNSTSDFTGPTILQSSVANNLAIITPNLSNAGTAGSLGAPTGTNAIIQIYSNVVWQLGGTTARTLNLAGNGSGTLQITVLQATGNAILNGPITATGTGAKTLYLNLPWNNPVTLTINGAISDATDGSPLSLRFNPGYNGATDGNYASFFLNGVNTFTGPITFDAGGSKFQSSLTGCALNITGAGQLGAGNYTNTINLSSSIWAIFNYGSYATQTLAGVISGAGNLTMNGSGTLILTASNTFTGTNMPISGTLILDFDKVGSGANLINTTNMPTLGGGSLIVKNKAGCSAAQTVSNVTVGAGGGVVLGDRNGGTTTTITLGSLTVSATASTTFLAGTAGADTTGLSITTTTGTNGLYGRQVWCSGAGTSYDWLTTVSVSSPYTLSGLASGLYTTMPTTAPALTDTTVNYVTTASATTSLTGNRSHSTLKLADNTTLALGGNALGLTGNGLLSVGSTASTISGSNANGFSGTSELVIHQFNTGGLTISAVIGGGIILTKAGSGTLTLTAANTYSGATYVNGGTLEIVDPGKLGNGTYSQNIVFSGNSGGVLKYSSSAAQTFGTGVISGGGGITQVGPGKLTLSGANNSFNGPLTVQSGTLSVPTINSSLANGPLGNSARAVILGYAGGGTGTLECTSASSATSTKTFTMATGGSGVFQINNAITQTITGVVSGSGSLAKTGPGTLILAGANTHSGELRVNAGVLSLPTACLSTNSVVYVNGGTLDLNFAGTNTIRTLYVNGSVRSANFYSSNTVSGITGPGVIRTLFPAAGMYITVR